MEPYGEVIWNGSMDREFQKSQQRPAPQVPVARGKTGHVQLRADGPRAYEEKIVDDLRDRWTREKQQT